MYIRAGFQGVQFPRRKNKNVPHFLMFKKKKKTIRNTRRHPTCLQLNEEGNSTKYMQSNIYNFEIVRKWLTKCTHTGSLCSWRPSCPDASCPPTALFWILTLCILCDKVCIEKSTWKLKWFVWGMADKPSINFFILIKNLQSFNIVENVAFLC